MLRTLVAAVILAVPALLPGALVGQGVAPKGGAQAGPPPGSGGPHGPMPKPTNLKVLPRDTSPEDLMKVMRGFTQQLGVRCNFCHAENATTKRPDFPSDEKPEKNTARLMISMTQEMNAKYLSQIHDPDATPAQKTVTCGTCHRGHNMPQVFQAVEQPGISRKP
jgi:hypothetical protein